ncbi:MAG TPA: protein hesA, partial [Nostocaceae cyanobacterium]|nr:protein hesA [Nostocaceae cyanobacterium]
MINLTPTELERYSRQMMLPNFGELAQKRLKSATVLVTGVGGL